MNPERRAKMLEHNDDILAEWRRMREFHCRLDRFLKYASEYGHPEVDPSWSVPAAWLVVCSDLRWRECRVCGDGIFLVESHGFMRHLNNWICSLKCAQARPDLGTALYGDREFVSRMDPTPDEIAARCAQIRKGWDSQRKRHGGKGQAWSLPQVEFVSGRGSEGER